MSGAARILAAEQSWQAGQAPSFGDCLDPRLWAETEQEFRIYGDDRGSVYAVVDEEDWHFLIRWRWCVKSCKYKKLYLRRAISTYWDDRSRKGSESIYLHVEVMKRTGILPESKKHCLVDHIDGDSLNCRRENLRWATHSQNGKNIRGLAARQGLII